MQHVYLKVSFWKISVWFWNGIFQNMGEKVEKRWEMQEKWIQERYYDEKQ